MQALKNNSKAALLFGSCSICSLPSRDVCCTIICVISWAAQQGKACASSQLRRQLPLKIHNWTMKLCSVLRALPEVLTQTSSGEASMPELLVVSGQCPWSDNLKQVRPELNKQQVADGRAAQCRSRWSVHPRCHTSQLALAPSRDAGVARGT